MSCNLEIKNLSYEIAGEILFKDVTFSLGHKEKIIIKGSNGSGKSTLLKIIGGLKRQSFGEVFLFHQKMDELKSFDQYRHDIGFLFQDSDDQFLAPTVIEDVSFGLLNIGVNKKDAKEKVLSMLTHLEIIKLQNAIPFKLSGGQKKLAALAATLILEPKILLLDEPSSGLDEKSTQILLKIIKETDSTTIVVSHDKDFISELGFTTMTLAKGRLL